MTTCSDTTVTEWNRAQSDWLIGTVTVNVTIDTQPVEISFDGQTFIDAAWIGVAGTTRSWQAFVTPADLPTAMTVDVTVHITDTSGPEPVEAYLDAGTITFT